MEPSDHLLPQQSLRDYLTILFRRKWAILGTFAVVFAAGVLTTRLTTPEYRTAATLLVDVSDRMAVARPTGPLDLQSLLQPQSVAMHLMELESGPFLARVMKHVPPNKGAAFRELKATSASDYPGLIQIMAVSTDPQLAAQLANTMAAEYLVHTRENALKQIEHSRAFVEGERARARQRLDRAEQDLLAFRQSLDVPNVISAQDTRTRQVLQLQERLDENASVTARLTAQMTEVQAQFAREPRMNRVPLERPNPRRDILQAKLADLETQRAALRAEYQEGAPQLVGVDAQIERIKHTLDAEPETWATEQRVVNPVHDSLRSRLQDLDFQLRGLRSDRTQLTVQLANARTRADELLPREVQLTARTTERDDARQSFNTLDAKLQDLVLREKQWAPVARIYEMAGIPRSPFTPRTRTNQMMAALLGLILGLAIAFLMEALDDRITTPEEVERELGLPVMGYLPLIPSRQSLLMTGLPERSPVAEAYRTLRSSISFAAVDQPLRTIVVSSSDKSEGKSVTSMNLAIAMALEGRRVILVDADLRRPTLHRLLEWEMEPGLTDVLMGRAESPEVLREFPEIPNLRIMTCGELPPNPAELINSTQMEELIARLAAEADVVIFDCPPCLPVTDATLLSTKVDGVLLVAAVGKARRAGLKYTKEQFDRARARLLGLVFNKVNGNLGSSYPYYDRRYYEEDRRRPGIGRANGFANSKLLGDKVRALVGRSDRTE